MTQKTYDPDTDYVCINGPISLKQNGKRVLVNEMTTDEKGHKFTFQMSHARPLEIAYLVEQKKTHMLYTDWLKTPQAEAFKDKSTSKTTETTTTKKGGSK